MSRRIFTAPQPPDAASRTDAASEEISENFDVEQLLAHGGEILRREIRNLMQESSRGKLNSGSARDLVNYLRLLHELKAEQQEVLANLSDEELEKMAKGKHEQGKT